MKCTTSKYFAEHLQAKPAGRAAENIRTRN